MAELMLDGGEVGGVGFERVRGEGVAEGVDAALLADAGAQLGHGVDLLGHREVDRACARAIGEEPEAGGRGLPVDTEVVQQALGQRHVPILHPLALLDTNGHAIGIEIRDFQGDDFADAQAGGVGGGEQEAMPGMRAGLEQPPDLLAAEDLWKLLRLFGGGYVEVRAREPQRHVVEKAERMGRLATRAPRELAFLNQVGEIGLDLLIGELIRRALVVLGQLHDLADVRLVGAGREATHRHVADHAGPELAHETPPSEELGRR